MCSLGSACRHVPARLSSSRGIFVAGGLAPLTSRCTPLLLAPVVDDKYEQPPSSSSSFCTRRQPRAALRPLSPAAVYDRCSTRGRRAFCVGSSDNVWISQRRLTEFLDAEKRFLAKGDYHKITVKQILECTDPDRLAPLILQELPARFATRLEQIESTCDNWREVPGLPELHQTLLESFNALQQLDAGIASSDALTQVVEDIRARHGPIVSLVATGAIEMKKRSVMPDRRISAWVAQFMESRIGTEMLIHHYMSLLEKLDEDRVGIVDTKCNPARICSDVVEHVRRNFASNKIGIKLQMSGADIEFSFVTEYLFFIVEELLINGVKATKAFKPPPSGAQNPFSKSRGSAAARDVTVFVCADQKKLTIKISDKGGGIPYKLSDKIWEFMFTTLSSKKTETESTESLVGTGLGLPLCRLFTEYLGGELQLFSMPGVGTDVYINFKRINLIDAGSTTDPS